MEAGQIDWETGEPDMKFCVAGRPDEPYPEEKTRPCGF